jgi:hypothetical protein
MPNRASNKSRAILKAVAEGNSFAQILRRDRRLTYHDLFRAAAEAPDWLSAPKDEVSMAEWSECIRAMAPPR